MGALLVITSDGWGSCSDGTVEETNSVLRRTSRVRLQLDMGPTDLPRRSLQSNPTVTAFDGQPIEYTLLQSPWHAVLRHGRRGVHHSGFEYSVEFEELRR